MNESDTTIDLAPYLAAPGRVFEVSSSDAEALLSELDAFEARLHRVIGARAATVRACLVARLAGSPARSGRSARDGEPDDYLTTDEAAALLKVSRKWLYRRAGRLPFARKLSRRELRFSRRGLERYMATRGA